MWRAVSGLVLMGMPMLMVHAQKAGGDPAIYPERLHDDLEVLRTFIHEAHPDPYRFTPKERIDAVVDSVLRSVDVPMAPDGFLKAIMPVFHAVGDPRLRPTVSAASGGWDNGTPLIPLRVRLLEDGLYVEEELKGFRSLPLGARIISINGLPATEIIERLCGAVVAEGANITYKHRLIEQEFPLLLARHVSSGHEHLVRYAAPDGTIEERVIMGITAEEMSRVRKPTGKKLAPWSGVPVQGSAAFWLTIRTFERDSLTRSGQRPEKYLAGLMKELRRSRTRTLIVDVRGAGGRELAMAELVFAAIASRPFRVVRDMTVRSLSPPARYDLATPQPEFYATVRDQFIEAPTGFAHVRSDDVRLLPIPPANQAFEGAVYVVADGMTRDAGATFVMMVKRERRGRIIGEETGTNAHSFTGGRELTVTTPHAGLRFSIPLIRYVPEGNATGPADRGESPHYELTPLPVGLVKGRDTVREAVLQLVGELR